MAKVTNYNEIVAEVVRQLNETAYDIEALLGRDLAVLAVVNIYQTNDTCTGFGQDFNNKVSVISSRQRIALIVDKVSSYYKDDFPLCQYVDLTDDVHEILMIAQAVYDRLQLI